MRQLYVSCGLQLLFFCSVCVLTTKHLNANEVVTVACADCYGSSAFYPQVSRELFPGQQIKWIHVRSEKTVQSGYMRSYEATRGGYAHELRVDLDSHASCIEVTARLKELGVRYVFGGMETGAMVADKLNYLLGIEASNDPSTSYWRREKAAMQDRLVHRIPTLLIRSADEAWDFAQTLNSRRVVLKPNAASGAEGVTFVVRTDRKAIERAFNNLLSKGKDNYGHPILEITMQPEIVGTEYVGQSTSHHGFVELLGMYRYVKMPYKDIRLYLIDDPQDLTSELANSLRPVVRQTHRDLRNLYGPGHGEYIREVGTDDWYVVEQAARAGGSGMIMLDAAIWGTSQLHMNLLRVLDPARYEQELVQFRHKPLDPNKMAIALFLISQKAGVIAEGTHDFLNSLPTRKAFSDFYDIYDGTRFPKTVDLTTVAGVVNLVGHRDDVLRDAKAVIRRQTSGQLMKYDKAFGVVGRCKEILTDPFATYQHNRRLRSHFDQWAKDWQTKGQPQ